MSKPTVVVVGDALIDELRGPEGIREFAGGAALNVAIGLAVLGVPTTLIAMVGEDADGETIKRALTRHGVRLIQTVGPNGSSRAVSDRTDGEPRYTFNDAARARAVLLDDTARAALATADLVAISCFPFDNTSQVDHVLSAIPNPEKRLVVDPNPRMGMMHDLATFRTNFERVASRSLLVKVGDEDSQMLYGLPLEAVRSRLRERGAGMVLATAGRHGASLVTSAGLSASEPIAPMPGPVIDTMGAGDATFSSTIVSILDHGTPVSTVAAHDLLARAMLIAAATSRREGALLAVPDGR
jgi:fructokinase